MLLVLCRRLQGLWNGEDSSLSCPAESGAAAAEDRGLLTRTRGGCGVIILTELGGDSSKDRMRPGAMGPKAAARLCRCRDFDVGLFDARWLEEEAAKLLPWQGPGLVGDWGHPELPCAASIRTGYSKVGGEGVIEAFLAIRARRLEIALDGGACGRRALALALARLRDSFLTCSISSHARKAARW